MIKNVSDASAVSANAQSQLLRAHVEREVRPSSVVLVTSAEAGDGKSLTAYSLANCLARSGRRTALVDATPGSARVPMPTPPDGEGVPVILSMPKAGTGLLRESMAKFVESARSSFEYTIVDSAPLLRDNAALALVGCVDGVLVSICVGRDPTENDEATMQIIEHSNGRIIGVVATTAQAVLDFADKRPSDIAPGRADRRMAPVELRPMQSVTSAVLAFLLFASSVAFLSKTATVRGHSTIGSGVRTVASDTRAPASRM